MAAYMIILARIDDREKFLAGYAAEAGALVERCGGKYVLRGPGALCLEGSVGDGRSVVISEWPDIDTARAFWDSPEYQEIKKLREGICDVEVVLVEAPPIGAAP